MCDEIDLTLWQSLPSIPNATPSYRGYALTSSRDTIYLSGGLCKTVSRSLLAFNTNTRQWTELGGMTHHRWGHRLASIEGGRYLFAIGGWGHRSKEAYGGGKDKKSLLKKVMGKKKERVVAEEHIEKLKSYEVYDVSKGIWKEAGELNEARRGFGMVTDPVSGKIYVFGGVGDNYDGLASVEVYNPYENEWDRLTSMPQPKKNVHPVVVGNRIHLYENGRETLTYDKTADKWIDVEPDEALVPKCPPNGRICSTCSFSGGEIIIYSYPVKDSNGETSDRWLVAHMAKRTKTWTVLPPVDAFTYYKMAVSEGKLVIAAGNSMIAFQLVDEMVDDDSTAAGSYSSSQSGSLRPSSVVSSSSRRSAEPIKDDGTWTLQPEFPSKPPDFRGYAVASFGELVYISGGCSGDGTLYRSFLSYNVNSKKWKKLPGMTHRRLGHKMAVSPDGRYVYVIGGGDGKTMRSMGVDIYDTTREMWTAAPGMNDYRVFFGVTVCNGMVFAFGGIGADNGNQLKTVERFDPDTFSWEFMTSMTESRGVCNVITVDGKVFVFGTPSQKVLAYDTNADKWMDDATLDDLSLPFCPPGGCVCASSSYVGGEVLVIKYPLEGTQGGYRRAANIYDANKQSWSSVHLLDTFACYSAVVSGEKCVVVTPNNQLQVCSIPKI